MPPKDTKILEFNQYQKLDKHHFLFIQILNYNRKDRWM